MTQVLLKKKAAVFFNSKSKYSNSLRKQLKFYLEEFEGEVFSSKNNDFDVSKDSFTAQSSFNKAVKEGAEVLILAVDVGQIHKVERVVNINAGAKNGQLSILGGDDVYYYTILEVFGKEALNMVFAVPWHINTSENKEFRDNAEKLWKDDNKLWKRDVNWRTALSYDAAQAFIEVIRRKANPTDKEIQELLHQLEVKKGASGIVSFSDDGDRKEEKMELVKVQVDEDAPDQYEFIPVDVQR